MRAVAYLFNRYPEATLTTLRREVRAVEQTGLTVCLFAHRPSLQPLASAADKDEAERTKYLAASGLMPLFRSLLRVSVRHPRRFLAALVYIARLRPIDIRKFGYLAVACHLLESLKVAPVDVIHVHFAQNSAVVALITRALGGPPWTMTVHGPEDTDTSHMVGLAARARAANGTMAISRVAANTVRTAVDDRSFPVRVQYMGVDDYYLAAPRPLQDKKRIICIARFVERKGHIVLIAALDILRSRNMLPQVDLVGDGPVRDSVHDDVEHRGLSSHVNFRGWQSEEEVRDSIDASCLMVLPSFAEGLPVSIMEAFARERPVVASDVGAINELVEHNISGILVKAGDIGGLAQALEDMMTKDIDTLSAMGRRGHAAVRERHQAARNASDLVSFWEKATSRS